MNMAFIDHEKCRAVIKFFYSLFTKTVFKNLHTILNIILHSSVF